MLPSAREHISTVEAKDRTEREEQLARQSREALIRQCETAIADAERRKTDPIFKNEDGETTYRVLRAKVERLANEYLQAMHTSRQSGRAFPFGFTDEPAICYFFGDTILAKLPQLADRISSRDGRGNGVDEDKRARVVEECDEVIARNKALLASLSE